MPVTFNDEPNHGTVYVDPAFRYDCSTRLLGREQYQNNVDYSGSQHSHSYAKSSRTSTPLSEYKRAYSRSGSPDNKVGNRLPVNFSEVDQACYESTAGINVNYIVSLAICKYYIIWNTYILFLINNTE
jgi:hypothetical protein